MRLAEICVRRPVFATMLVMLFVVVGWMSYTRLGVDLFPNVDFPIAIVTTVLKGASVEEMETRVTKPIEEAVNQIQGIDELRSTTKEGVSQGESAPRDRASQNPGPRLREAKETAEAQPRVCAFFRPFDRRGAGGVDEHEVAVRECAQHHLWQAGMYFFLRIKCTALEHSDGKRIFAAVERE